MNRTALKNLFSSALTFPIGLAWAVAVAPQAQSAENLQLVIKDHKFAPETLEVPAGQKLKVVVKNEDSTPEEFESKTLKREKIVPARSQISMNIGPLDAGEYPFVGEFHEKTAQGKLIAK